MKQKQKNPAGGSTPDGGGSNALAEGHGTITASASSGNRPRRIIGNPFMPWPIIYGIHDLPGGMVEIVVHNNRNRAPDIITMPAVDFNTYARFWRVAFDKFNRAFMPKLPQRKWEAMIALARECQRGDA